MKRYILIIALFIAAFFQSAAAQDNAKTEFGKTLNTYYSTKNALATDNADLAGTEAKEMLASLKAYPAKSLTAVQQAIWKEQSAVIQKATQPMILEKDIKVQRKQFENISYAMIKLVKALKLNSKPVYLQHCPMAKASWLNETEAIQNPYYGSMMYDCGDVTETIK